jgi:TonB family protein
VRYKGLGYKRSDMLRCCLILAISMSAAAQGPVYRPGPDVAAPFVVARPKPEYTEEAGRAKLEGGVLLSLVVGADAQPRDISVARSLGLGLDESAIENVRTWQFKSGTKAGMPVDVAVQVEVFFRPKRNLWDWHLVRAVFQPPPGATRPVLINVKFPPTVDEEENASVTMTFDIEPTGIPANPRIVKSSDAKWERELLRAVGDDWRFRPGMVDGKPVTVPAWFVFIRGARSPIPPVPIPATISR